MLARQLCAPRRSDAEGSLFALLIVAEIVLAQRPPTISRRNRRPAQPAELASAAWVWAAPSR